MGLIHPTKEQIKSIFAMSHEGPIVYVNLLKYKPDGGAESYSTYIEKFNELMLPKGVEAVSQGKNLLTAIGSIDWDEVLLVRYPSKQVWVDMVNSKEYQAIQHLRDDAIEDSRLFLIDEEL